MGSKQWMLANSLGDILLEESTVASRFVDLFAGAGAVTSFVSQNVAIPTLGIDLQQYSKVLIDSVVGRTKRFDPPRLDPWITVARTSVEGDGLIDAARAFLEEKSFSKVNVLAARQLCARKVRPGPTWNAYGGHYLSPEQALVVDALVERLPQRSPTRAVALAALMTAVTRCSASPGHLAQPLQPKGNGLKYVEQAWRRSILDATARAVEEIADTFAKVQGRGIVANANDYVRYLKHGDLVFIDPPYSGVQYSRFYHVLEAIATGRKHEVSGVGRYPAQSERPVSKYSQSGQSGPAMDALLKAIAAKGAKAVLTFPAGQCSNGLSAKMIEGYARKHFAKVEIHDVQSKLSTLGGTKDGRGARRDGIERILTMRPRH